MEKEPAILVGVDWPSTEHQLGMIGASGPVQRAFAHDTGGPGVMVDIAIAIEVARGRWSRR
jgi:hypothetical protein